MKVTFPHMGSFWVGLKALFQMLEVEVVVPPPITKKTITLGSIHAPESACLPFKINLGNFIEAIDLGADTIIMAGGYGPCRFGYFAQVHREILHNIGHKIDILVVEQPRNDRQEFFRSIKALFPNKSWFQLIKAIHFGWKKVLLLDSLEASILKNRAYEINKGDHTRFWNKALRCIDKASNKVELEKQNKLLTKELQEIPKDFTRDVLKIAIVGEIYMMLEPTANLNVDEKLGYLGVSLVKTEFVSDYIREKVFQTKNIPELFAYAKPYMQNEIGGHGFHTIANTVKYAKKGFDGAVQIMPFTCIPEIVSMSIIDKVSEDCNIPVLTLIFDEHSGEAGVETRIEAFVDLIRRKNMQHTVTNNIMNTIDNKAEIMQKIR